MYIYYLHICSLVNLLSINKLSVYLYSDNVKKRMSLTSHSVDYFK